MKKQDIPCDEIIMILKSTLKGFGLIKPSPGVFYEEKIVAYKTMGVSFIRITWERKVYIYIQKES